MKPRNCNTFRPNYEQIYLEILSYNLIEIIGKDTKLKKLSGNTWHGKSPLREDGKPSFSVSQKGETWIYYDHATGESGNIFTYLKQRHGITGLLAVAEYLGIEVTYTTETPQPRQQETKNWEYWEKLDKLTIINQQKQRLSRIKPAITKAESTNFTYANEWSYPAIYGQFHNKQLGTFGQLEDYCIIPQKYRGDDGIKRWRYLLNTESSEAVLHSKSAVQKQLGFEPIIGLYREDEIRDEEYLVISEGESDCDRAISAGLNASSFPSSNYESQVNLLAHLRESHPEIRVILISGDNDEAGIRKAWTTFKACNEVGLPAIAFNPATKKTIKSFDTSDLITDKKGYDLRDYLTANSPETFIKWVSGMIPLWVKPRIKDTVIITDKKGDHQNYCNYYLHKFNGAINTKSHEKTVALAILDKRFTENLKKIVPVTFLIKDDLNHRNFELTARLLEKQGYKIGITYDLRRSISLNQWDSRNLTDISSMVDLRVNERYLGNHQPDPEADIIGLKAPKGTGKTEWLKSAVQENIRHGKKTMLISHRIQLGGALCARFGLNYIDNMDETGQLMGIGLCVDSLRPRGKARINPDDWFGADVVLDEVEQILWHLFSAKTEVSKYRPVILSTLATILKQAIAGGGKIYCSDADLSPISIEFIKQILGYDAKTWVLENSYKPYSNRIATIYKDNDAQGILNEIINHVRIDKKVFISTSAQKCKSAWGSINLESYLGKIFPNKKILRIDSESISDSANLACGIIDKLNQELTKYDIVIASPAIETGVSIDIRGHFDAFFGIYQGHQTINSVAQSIERIREDIPRYIWCNEYGFSSQIAGGLDTVRELIKSQHKQAKSAVASLSQSDFFALDPINMTNHSPALFAWAKYASLINQESKKYRETLIKKMLRDGYRLQIASGATLETKAIKQDLKANKDTIYTEECQAICNAQDIDEASMKLLQEKKNKTITERRELRKAEIKSKYSLDNITPDLIQMDDDGGYNRLKLYYYATVWGGDELCKIKDGMKLSNMAKENHGEIFIPDLNRTTMINRITLIQKLGLDQFVSDTKSAWTNENLIEYKELLLKFKDAIKITLKTTISDTMSVIQMVQAILSNNFGVRLTGKQIGTKEGRGKREYRWEKAGITEIKEEIILNWYLKDQKLWEGETEAVS